MNSLLDHRRTQAGTQQHHHNTTVYAKGTPRDHDHFFSGGLDCPRQCVCTWTLQRSGPAGTREFYPLLLSNLGHLLVVLLGKSKVTEELGINTLEGAVALSDGLLDSVAVSLVCLVMGGMVL
eukprot:TRINITY_DN33092_c0_g1_i1.p1 TRINITY_DN33092_c0_g1~~TRINITY_DN33092_c0_g1_i1.p1  ORF type:complete len:122 (+),score=10.43 TRINITY_DN33092_c0_g1_i1:27-392(+)